jgi:transposase
LVRPPVGACAEFFQTLKPPPTTHYCQLDEDGKEVESGKVLNSEASVRKHFGKMPSARIAVEAGARTHWWVQQLEGFGHQVLVANAREFAQSKTDPKNDSNDAERLARYARLDPAALRPVTLRNAEQQNDLHRIRVRHALLRTRTGLVNLARGLAKEAALRLPATITRNFAQRSLALLSPELASVLLPVLTAIDDLTQKIEDQDELLEHPPNPPFDFALSTPASRTRRTPPCHSQELLAKLREILRTKRGGNV